MRNIKVGLQRTTVVNFPRRLAAAVFLPGCNMRCGYCHNAELALANTSGKGLEFSSDNTYEDISDVFEHLEKRAKVLSGFAISGGEPLLSPALEPLIRKAKSLGLDVKIDTNGLLPDKLNELLHTPELCPDMIALDIKTAPARYGELMPVQTETSFNLAETAILKTLDILNKATTENPALELEFRTVLVPDLVGASEIEIIANLLPKNADWEFANFIPGHCLTPSWNDIRPYTPEEVDRLVKIAQKYLPKAVLR